MTKVFFAAALALLVLAVNVLAEGGWSKRGASLLLHDSTGELVSEIGLVSSEEGSGGKLIVRETRGGAAKSGRFAWTLERAMTWNAARTKLLESKHLLKLLGSRGEELWSRPDGDAADTLDPVVFSAEGEAMLVSARGKEGWRVSAQGHLGNTIAELYPVPELEDMRLTPDGRFALVRWTILEKGSTHTFWDLKTQKRRDVPSSEMHLGRAELFEDGKVKSNGKLIVDLAAPEAPAAAPASPASLPPPPPPAPKAQAKP